MQNIPKDSEVALIDKISKINIYIYVLAENKDVDFFRVLR